MPVSFEFGGYHVEVEEESSFELMVKSFGPWNTWDRASHLAYGLIRGVEYSRMERCSNDNPHSVMVAPVLWKLGAWEEHPYVAGKSTPHVCWDEIRKLITWVKKEPRPKVTRGMNTGTGVSREQ